MNRFTHCGCARSAVSFSQCRLQHEPFNSRSEPSDARCISFWHTGESCDGAYGRSGDPPRRSEKCDRLSAFGRPPKCGARRFSFMPSPTKR